MEKYHTQTNYRSILLLYLESIRENYVQPQHQKEACVSEYVCAGEKLLINFSKKVNLPFSVCTKQLRI